MKDEQSFFDFAAAVGLTKHIGESEATTSLLGLCHIKKENHVLDVGCGVGVTPVMIAREYGCRITGVDINEGMVMRSRERAKKARLADRVEFLVADAQELPFPENSFDVVITESVTAFPEDKQKAVNEYVRVTKPGGYVGLNESTWLKVPPPPELIQWVSQEVGANASPLSSDEWTDLLRKAGLKEIQVQTYEIDVKNEAKGLFRRYGVGGMMGVMSRMVSLYMKNPFYRAFVKKVKKEGVTPADLDQYFGYGLYIGQK
jgi:ubiquinone/menaquinone biosynthesis C-methylase UbiE